MGHGDLCVDYCRLNAVTVPDRCVITNIQTIHNKLAGSAIYSSLDLVRPITSSRLKKSTSLKQQFVPRPNNRIFNNAVDCLFRHILKVITYIDDLLVFSDNAADHEVHLLKLLQRLESVSLRVNVEKNRFLKPQVFKR